MANICSKHQGYEKHCKLCNTNPKDALRNDGTKMFPNWDVKVAEAEAAGETICKKCGFEHYQTIGFCPLCEEQDEL